MRDVKWIGVVVVGWSAVLGACAGPGSAGARGAEGPNTGLSMLTEAPGGVRESADGGAGGGVDGGEVGEPARRGTPAGAGRSRTRLDTLAADTDVNVDDVLASAEGRGAVRAPVASESVDGGGNAGATDDVTGDGAGETTPGVLVPLEGDAPNAGLAALASEEVGAAAKPDEQAGAREAEVAKLAGLRRDLAVFLSARREQGAKLMADAALIVVGEAIGYDGEARPSTPDETGLTSQERTTLSAIRALGRALSQEGKVQDPARAAQLVEGVLSTLREASAVRIARAALCTRVEGFGRYEPFAEYTFLAGRVTKM
ncbi:MAG: hypothetical protein JNL50_03550, partial [Phycisphaerae bacterium]|nr:hypothetical protein [Phycisphaerae bacterium]